MNTKHFHKKILSNQSGMVLVASLIVSFIVGLVSLAILNNIDRKNKNSERKSISFAANTIKNELLTALNSKAAWEKTKQANNTLIRSSVSGRGGGITVGTVLQEMSIYKSETELLLRANSTYTGFDTQGKPCQNFNPQAGNDTCPFRYVVKLKNVTESSGTTNITVSVKLTFNPQNNKFVFNSQTADYNFDYTPSTDVDQIREVCQSLGGTYNTTSNICSQQMTVQTSACTSGNTFRGIASSANYCSNIQLTSGTSGSCPAGEFASGFDVNQNITCRPL